MYKILKQIYILSLVLLIVLIIGSRIVFSKNIYKENINLNLYSGEANMETEKIDGEIISYFNYGKYKYSIPSISKWKLDIYKELNIGIGSYLKLHTLNIQECGDWDGLCLGGKVSKPSDCGPFQINQIHKVEFAYCLKLVKEGQRLRRTAEIDGKWDKVIAIRNELFRSQVIWVADRLLSFEKRICYKYSNGGDKASCQGFLHNGNTRKDKYGVEFRKNYANKSRIIYNILDNYYNN